MIYLDFFHVILTQQYFFIFFNILWYLFFLSFFPLYFWIYSDFYQNKTCNYYIIQYYDFLRYFQHNIGLQDISHVMHKTGVIFPETDVLSDLQTSYLSASSPSEFSSPRPSSFSHHNNNQVRSVKLNTSSQSLTSLLREWGSRA